MKQIAVGTLKGGTGKTMVLFNLAGILAETKKVLVIDVDPQSNFSDTAGIDVTDQYGMSIRHIFENPQIDPRKVIVYGPVEGLPKLDVIPSHILLTETEMNLAAKAGRELILAHYIEDNMDVFGEYDYILYDTNPSMGIVNQNAFLAADDIIIVSDIGRKSKVGTDLFMYLWDKVRKGLRKPENVRALIVNNYDKRLKQSEAIMEAYAQNEDLRDILVKTPIPARVAFKNTEFEYKPVNLTAEGTDGWKDANAAIRAVVEELYEKGVF